MPVFITISRIETQAGPSLDVMARRWQDQDGRLRKTHEGIALVTLISKREIDEFRYNPPTRLEVEDRWGPTGGHAA